MFLKKNTASQTVGFCLVNASTGAALTGATVSVRRCLDGTFAATTGAVTEDSGGLYKFAPSQADTNGDQVAYYFTATSAIPVCLNLRTTAADMADTVRFGLTALPNAAAEASGGLVTRGTGTGQISVSSGQVILQSGTGTGQLDFTSGVVKANVTQFGGSAGTFASGVPAVNATQFGGATVTATTSVTFPAASTVATTTGAVGSVTGAVGSVTGAVGSVTGNVGGNVTGSVGSVVGAVGSVTGNVGGNVTGSVGSVATGGITAASLAADAITAAKVAADVGTEIATAVWASGTRTVTSLSGLTVDTVTTLTNLPTIPANWLTAAGIAADAGAEIADAVWDEVLSGHLTAGTTGAGLNAAGSAGDPWSTALPGAYSAGSAGYIVGTNLDATVSSRAAASGVNVTQWSGTSVPVSENGYPTVAVGFWTDWASAQAVGDVGVSYASDGGVLVHSVSVGAVTDIQSGLATAANLATLTGYVDTEIAAIKAKTDNLPAAPAAVGDIPTANQNADAVIARNIAGGSSTGRTVGQALASLRNKVAFNVPVAGQFTVYATDDTTALWTGTYTASAGADPVTALDPA